MGQIINMDKINKVMHFVDGLKPATQVKVNYNMLRTLEMAIEIAVRYNTAHFDPTQFSTFNYFQILHGLQINYQRKPMHHPSNRPFQPNNNQPSDDNKP